MLKALKTLNTRALSVIIGSQHALADLIAVPGYQRIEVDNQLTSDVFIAVPESLAVAPLRNLLITPCAIVRRTVPLSCI